MPHAVTQSCVGDGSCVYSCPVNCIQPTPDDPAFEFAEMLFIDPAACVDCGACTSACPVDAIKPHHYLDPSEQVFLEVNAAHFRERRARPTLAPVPPRLRVRDRGEELRIAVVGSGPAAMYAAEELLTIPTARVTVFERLERPYGLARSGVAPDHRRTRRISHQLDRIRSHPRLTLRLGVEIGRDLSHESLAATHHAVIYGVGSIADRPLVVPGAELPGVASATEFVGWYNGHPDFIDRRFDLAHRRAVVIGNGNVALDVARILTIDPDALVDTEITPTALEALRASQIEEVVVVGRRDPSRAAFTLPELIGLSATPGVDLDADDPAVQRLTAGADHDHKLRLLRELRASGSARRVALRFLLAPIEVVGDARAEAVRFAPQTLAGDGSAAPIAGAAPIDYEAGLVLSAIGYRGTPVPALPFDDDAGVVPNEAGRVIVPGTGEPVPGTYVVGWIKRGPSGFIGSNKRCAQETVATLVADYNAGVLAPPARLASA